MKVHLKEQEDSQADELYAMLLVLEHELLEEPRMDLGVKLCYLIWCSQDRWDEDRHIHSNAVKNIYGELARTSPLFSYWERQGMDADDVIRMLTNEHRQNSEVV